MNQLRRASVFLIAYLVLALVNVFGVSEARAASARIQPAKVNPKMNPSTSFMKKPRKKAAS